MMMMGENSRTVAQAVDAKIQEIQSTLPKGLKLKRFMIVLV
jgi:cobalt-zinc-cadmium resistance protein CzcA